MQIIMGTLLLLSLPGEGLALSLRKEVDLRPYYVDNGLYLKNQGLRPSCSVFAVVSALEYEKAFSGVEAQRLSEDFLIWAIRKINPETPINDGFHFAEVLAALNRYGIPPHNLMPNTYGKKIEDIRPSEATKIAALENCRVKARWLVPESPEGDILVPVVEALNAGHPVIIGVGWPHPRTVRRSHLLSAQKALEGSGHAVTLIGYRCPDGTESTLTFIFRNSYGYSWGLAGCGFMSADYLSKNLLSALFLELDR